MRSNRFLILQTFLFDTLHNTDLPSSAVQNCEDTKKSFKRPVALKKKQQKTRENCVNFEFLGKVRKT